MPDTRFTKGKAALDRVALLYGPETTCNLGNLTRDIRKDKASRNCDITSCPATAVVVSDAINDKKLKAVDNLFPMVHVQKVAAISDLLNRAKMVYIQMTPDHHFIVFPIDTNMVVILQGFQGVYNLIDWMDGRGSGVMGKLEFITTLINLGSDDYDKKKTAVADLFSFDLVRRDSTWFRKAYNNGFTFPKEVREDIDLYFGGKLVAIQAVNYKDL